MMDANVLINVTAIGVFIGITAAWVARFLFLQTCRGVFAGVKKLYALVKAKWGRNG